MPAKPSESHTPSVALEIKAGSITLPILKLFTADLVAVDVQLGDKLQRAPDFFRNAPVIIELGELDPDREQLEFPALAELLRSKHLVPVGVRGGNALQHHAAQAAKLAVLAEVKHEPVPAPAKPAPAAAAPKTPAPVATKLVEQPVRSGQKIYAPGGDLIVRAQVSAGAELMADGNIHVYGTLRGRALAGVQGNLEARIFCTDLQSELVGIGGQFKLSDDIDPAVRGKAAYIRLVDHALVIDSL